MYLSILFDKIYFNFLLNNANCIRKKSHKIFICGFYPVQLVKLIAPENISVMFKTISVANLSWFDYSKFFFFKCLVFCLVLLLVFVFSSLRVEY